MAAFFSALAATRQMSARCKSPSDVGVVGGRSGKEDCAAECRIEKRGGSLRLSLPHPCTPDRLRAAEGKGSGGAGWLVGGSTFKLCSRDAADWCRTCSRHQIPPWCSGKEILPDGGGLAGQAGTQIMSHTRGAKSRCLKCQDNCWNWNCYNRIYCCIYEMF